MGAGDQLLPALNAGYVWSGVELRVNLMTPIAKTPDRF
jgi:hypothetical protein